MRDPSVVLREALDEVLSYLGDAAPPALVVDSVRRLASAPPEILAAELRSWALSRKRRSPVPYADHLLFGLRKMQAFEELGALPGDGYRVYLSRLVAALVAALPADARDAFVAGVAGLLDGDAEVGPGPGASSPVSRPGSDAAAPARSSEQFLAAIDGGQDLTRGFEAAGRGGEDPWSETGIFRAFAAAVPDQLAPAGAASTSPPVEALHRIVAVEQDRAKAATRWEQMVREAIGHFNEGAISRAVTLLELAARLVAEGEVSGETAARAREAAHLGLSRERLMEAALDPAQRALLRKVLDHFPGLAPKRLVDQIAVEGDRRARRLLLALLEVSGPAARAVVLSALEASHAGRVRGHDNWYLPRNLLYLLNRMPRPVDAEVDWELRVTTTYTALHLPVQLVREAAMFVAGLPTPAAGTLLVERMRELEKILVEGREGEVAVPQLWRVANALASALARAGTSEARLALVDHALSFHPRLGDTSARLADLAGEDLSGQPEVVAALLETLGTLAPARVLGVLAARNEKAVERIVRTLATTRTPEARRGLEDLATRFPDREFGKLAARAVRPEIGLAPDPDARVEPGPREEPALAGDLRFFSLPHLVQSLQQIQASGQVRLRGENGNVFAVFRLVDGRLAECVAGGLRGENAFYQAFQNPTGGRFEFFSEPDAPAVVAEDVTLLLLEAIRRYDDLQNDRQVVGDDAYLRATARRPTLPADESDGELVRLVWTRVREGTSVVECEMAARRDSFTVRRLLAHWVREGAAQVAGTGRT
ncbi:MAG: hypothetical protein AMXMBFR36_23080 [Acidobacteriota bacterium]